MASWAGVIFGTGGGGECPQQRRSGYDSGNSGAVCVGEQADHAGRGGEDQNGCAGSSAEQYVCGAGYDDGLL